MTSTAPRTLALCLALCLGSLAFSISPCGADEGRTAGTVPAALGSTRITADAMRQDVEWLTSPRWQGRATGAAACDSLARVLTQRLLAAGWKPVLSDSSGYDFFAVSSGVRVEGKVGLRDNEHGYTFGADYTPLSCSADGHALSDLVFVGYGVSAPERGYDDYAGVEAKGKVVVAFLGEPGTSAGRGLRGAGVSPYGGVYRKLETALLHGACAIIVAPPPSAPVGTGRAWRLSAQLAARDVGIPALMVPTRVARTLLTGLDLDALQKSIDGHLEPLSQPAQGRRAEVLTQLRRNDGVARSSLLMLPADVVSDLGQRTKGEIDGADSGAVLLLAAINGGGTGPDGANPELHPGANEDAAAVVTVLEIAKLLPMVPRTRTVYVALVSGHELGGAGARSIAGKLPDVSTVVYLHAMGHAGGTRVECGDPNLTAAIADANAGLTTRVALESTADLSSWEELTPFRARDITSVAILGPGAATDGTASDLPKMIDFDALLARARFAFAVAQSLARR